MVDGGGTESDRRRGRQSSVMADGGSELERLWRGSALGRRCC